MYHQHTLTYVSTCLVSISLTYVNTCLVSISLDSSNETRYDSIYFLDIVRVLNKFIVQKHDNANVKEMFSVVKLVSDHTKQYTDPNYILYPELSFLLRYTTSLPALILQDFCNI